MPDSPEPRFSLIVDTSIQDSRPNNDLLAPLKTASLSTPLAERVRVGVREEHLDNILKSSRRKRSRSVADGESFMQWRVMLNSLQIMEIIAIDEKMMASFIKEKENSIMIQAAHSGWRKRSLSTTEAVRPSCGKFRRFQWWSLVNLSLADHRLKTCLRRKDLVCLIVKCLLMEK